MQRTKIVVTYQRTHNLGNYSNVRPSISIEGTLEESDDPEVVKQQLRAEARAFVHEVIDEALESEGQAAHFSNEPRYRLAYTVEETYLGSGFDRGRHGKARAPERLLVIVPQPIRLHRDDNPGRQWWGDPYGPSSKLRLSHARQAAADWLTDHEGYRLIDCSDGDLSKISAWALEEPRAPEPEPELIPGEALAAFDDEDDQL